ncbi:MAG: hypothetical protein JWN15_485, partial [Firmicutes bacterium]|nr:hypothetical protein [Bacillota bacterium]
MSLYDRLDRRFGRKVSAPEKHRFVEDALWQCLSQVPWVTLARAPNRATLTVLVVGAGFAGLSAAWWLKQFGVGTVRVIEARNRLGGRVLSLKRFSGGRIIEAGAELIGLNHPLWLHFARKFGLGLSVFTHEDDFAGQGLEMPILLNGSLLTPEQARALFAEMTLAFEQIAGEAEPVDALRPWRSPDAVTLDAISVADRIQALDVSRLTKQALMTQFENDNATAVRHQSYLALLSAVKGGGLMNYFTASEVFRCERGNQSLASCLAQSIAEQGEGTVLLGHPATAIAIRTVAPGRVEVIAGERRFRGDYVILAVPPSLWSGITITPALPPDLRPNLGPAIKYLSDVQHRFWLQAGLAPVGLSDQLGETWEGTDNQMQLCDQGLELSVFAGGPDAAAALRAANPHRYFARRIDALYPGYADEVLRTRFVAWPRQPWTM